MKIRNEKEHQKALEETKKIIESTDNQIDLNYYIKKLKSIVKYRQNKKK